MRIEHFQQNGNIKNIAHIDASTNELAANLELQQKVEELNLPPIQIDIPLEQPTSSTTEKIDPKENPATTAAATEEEEESFSLIRYPCGKGCVKQILWIITWPIHLVFFFTIPDCERPRLRNWFPLTFTMCIIWIGSLSYMVAWMITIIGKIFREILL